MNILLAEVPWLDFEDVIRNLIYISQGPMSVSREVVQNALRHLVPQREKAIMASFGQEYLDEGIRRGLQQGIQQGQARSLARLLEKRFGVVPTHCRESIFSADLDDH